MARDADCGPGGGDHPGPLRPTAVVEPWRWSQARHGCVTTMPMPRHAVVERVRPFPHQRLMGFHERCLSTGGTPASIAPCPMGTHGSPWLLTRGCTTCSRAHRGSLR
jgi:hypothetical protein